MRGSGGRGDPWIVSIPELHVWHVERARTEPAAGATVALGASVGITGNLLTQMSEKEAVGLLTSFIVIEALT